jgi:pilus assembly protein CpaB
MNVTRIAILGVAALAAGAAVLLVRGMLGGGTPPVEASAQTTAVTTTDVLVASQALQPGQKLEVEMVRWDAWPKAAVTPSLITRDIQPDLDAATKGAVVRAPLVAGEPVTDEKIARAGSASFLAATIAPGKRAISISISAESGAGGFILPNDRVDVLLTRDVSQGNIKTFRSEAILRDVRVLAIDQILRQEKDQQSAVGKTATLELGPLESEMISQAQASGTLSLALRALGDNATKGDEVSQLDRGGSDVSVIRYGVSRTTARGVE